MTVSAKKLIAIILGILLIFLTADWFFIHRRLGPDTRWVGNSEEYQFTCLQIYRLAFNQLKKNVSEVNQPWAIVMDVDDTCLSTVDYQKTKQLRWLPFLRPVWATWCKEKKGIVVPGAAEFTEKIKGLGGLIILLTDRREELRKVTEENLEREGIVYDALLMQAENSTKAEWMDLIKQGKAVPGRGPLEVVMVLGDKKRDFYSDDRDHKHSSDWGSKYIIIPNPMNNPK